MSLILFPILVLLWTFDTAGSLSLLSNVPAARFSLGQRIKAPQGLAVSRGSEHSMTLAHNETQVNPATAPISRELESANAGPTTSEQAMRRVSGEWAHNFFAFLIYFLFALMLLSVVVWSMYAYQRYLSFHSDDDATFGEYVQYKLADWFVMTKYAPPLVVMMLSLTVIVIGSLLYSILVGDSPAHALYKVFTWVFAAESGDEETVAGRFMGVLITGAGLIILSILLGIVAEAFASRMSEIRAGQMNVIEGDHVVIVGHSECTRCLLEELANARESEGGGVFVVLTHHSKADVENELLGSDANLRNSRVIVRSGTAVTMHDLLKANVDAAKQVVLLADTKVSREEADAKNLRTALALKTKNWPVHGRIVVQCSCLTNSAVFKNVDKSIEVVVVGDIVAKLMVQSARQPGLAVVFGQMLGFEGDEFYIKAWPELVGCSLLEAAFRFADAVVLGVFDGSGACHLNPGWDYVIKDDDRIIVLAEDDSAYEPVEEPYFAMPEDSETTWRGSSSKGFSGYVPDAPVSILIFGWNDKISTLLVTLDHQSAPGSSVTIVSPRDIDYRERELEKLAKRGEKQTFRNLATTHVYADGMSFTSRTAVQNLKHWTFNHIFILADVERQGRSVSDDFAVAIFSQMQTINAHLSADVVRHEFHPVVEMCEDCTSEHLKICGAKNLIYSNSLVAKALAAVTEDGSVNAIYAELMAATTNEFGIFGLHEFFPEGHDVPTEVSFGDVVYLISRTGAAILLGWTEEGEWLMNPKDKIARRPWSEEDKVAVIRKVIPPESPSASSRKVFGEESEFPMEVMPSENDHW